LKTLERTTTIKSPVAIQLTLICAWCAREIEGVDGQREMASGHVLLTNTNPRFRLLGGRPVCVECGGPLFIEDWHAVRRLSPINPEIFAEDESPLEIRKAA
jgi:hypothetical protein